MMSDVPSGQKHSLLSTEPCRRKPLIPNAVFIRQHTCLFLTIRAWWSKAIEGSLHPWRQASLSVLQCWHIAVAVNSNGILIIGSSKYPCATLAVRSLAVYLRRNASEEFGLQRATGIGGCLLLCEHFRSGINGL